MNMDAAISGGKGAGGVSMSNKVLCPWCGEEMFHPRPWQKGMPDMGGYNWTVQAKCRECGAFSPKVYGRTRWEAENKLFNAALRRYNPPLKPMSLEEVKDLRVGTLV
jgi:ribosomal protein L37E